MADKRFFECAFLIPLRKDRGLSDGKAHSKNAWLWLEKRLFEFGGATRQRERLEGWYVDRDTGKRVRDFSRKYFVAMPQEDLDHLRALLAEACLIFRQKCIYLSVAGRVEFVERPKNEKN